MIIIRLDANDFCPAGAARST